MRTIAISGSHRVRLGYNGSTFRRADARSRLPRYVLEVYIENDQLMMVRCNAIQQQSVPLLNKQELRGQAPYVGHSGDRLTLFGDPEYAFRIIKVSTSTATVHLFWLTVITAAEKHAAERASAEPTPPPTPPTPPTTCPLCADTTTLHTLPCGHQCCNSCVRPWITRHAVCPICFESIVIDVTL